MNFANITPSGPSFDTTVIAGTWSATDTASGVKSFEVAIGTDTATQINNFYAWTDQGDGIINATISSLNLFKGLLYYFSVRAKDMAGNIGNSSSDTWKVIWNEKEQLSTTAGSFGHSSAISEDGQWLVVGVPTYDPGLSANQGVINVYQWNTGLNTWTYKATLEASDKTTNAYFGRAVSVTVYDSTGALTAYPKIIVGAPMAGSYGAVYFYKTSDGTNFTELVIPQNKDLINADGHCTTGCGNGEAFGQAIAISKNIILVGAPGQDCSTTGGTCNRSDCGALYRFELDSSSTSLSAINKYSTSSAQLLGARTAGDELGTSISMDTSGKAAIGSAVRLFINNASSTAITASGNLTLTNITDVSITSGSFVTAGNGSNVYLTFFNGTSWSAATNVTVIGPPANFGTEVSLYSRTRNTAGTNYLDVFLIATGDNDVRLLKVSGATATEFQTITPNTGPSVGDKFGASACMANDTIVISSPGKTSGSGSIYSFR
jgi:hypothetical protein